MSQQVNFSWRMASGPHQLEPTVCGEAPTRFAGRCHPLVSFYKKEILNIFRIKITLSLSLSFSVFQDEFWNSAPQWETFHLSICRGPLSMLGLFHGDKFVVWGQIVSTRFDSFTVEFTQVQDFWAIILNLGSTSAGLERLLWIPSPVQELQLFMYKRQRDTNSSVTKWKR